MIRPAAFVTALCGLATGLHGQNPTLQAPSPHGWLHAIEHYGKWATAGAAIGFTVLAAREHQTANDNWSQLLALCARDNAACAQSPDGRYVESSAELLYQHTLEYDRRARRRLIAGQVALLASATLFILDLSNRHGGPPNIPFHGLRFTAHPAGAGAQVQLRLPF